MLNIKVLLSAIWNREDEATYVLCCLARAMEIQIEQNWEAVEKTYGTYFVNSWEKFTNKS